MKSISLLTLTSLILITLTSPLMATVKPIEIEENYLSNQELLIALENTTIEGELTTESESEKSDITDEDIYYNIHTFEGIEGENITIELYSDDVYVDFMLTNDVDISLMNEDDIIAEFSVGGETNSEKIVITLPTTDTYKIYVFGYEDTDYQLIWRNATEKELADNLINQGMEQSVDQSQEKIQFFQQALTIYEEIGDISGILDALDNVGLVYNGLGEYEKAIDYLQQSWIIIQESDMKSMGEDTLMYWMGDVYYNLEDYETAMYYFQQSLIITEEREDSYWMAIYLRGLGNSYYSLGEYEKAIGYYQQSLTIFENTHSSTEEALTLRNIAVLERKRGNLEIALTKIESAINIIESLRSKYISPELRQSYFATVQEYYQLYLDLLMELDQQNPNQSYNKLAFNISEKSRARVLLELLTEANADIKEGVDPALLNQEKDLQNQLDATEKLRLTIYNNSDSTEEQKTHINQRQENLIEDYKKLQDEIRRVSPKYADLEYPQPLTLEQVQSQILDDDTLLLQYALGEEKSYLFAITKDSFNSYELPSINDLTKTINTLRANITIERRGLTYYQEASMALSDLILEPVADQLNDKKRLLIVADGDLNYIPFSALAIPNQTEFISLISTHEIVNLPSASTLNIIRNQSKNRPPTTNLMAMIADPVFSVEDERVSNQNHQNSPENNNETLDQLALNRASSGFDIGWDRLLGTRQEAQEILNLIPDDQEIKAFDFNANRDFMNNPEISQSKYVHFATHGFLNSQNPDLSGIVLSLIDQQGNPQNGYLRLGDIFNLKLNADLVVLSACETALGAQVKGEGIVGLTRGLMYAGAERLILSLWNVDDQATAKFMTIFYQLILENNLTPAQALRETQLQMQKDPNYNHPYYWAAFVLQGEYN